MFFQLSKKIDLFLILPILGLMSLGLLLLYSAGYNPDHSVRLFSWLPLEISSNYFIRQFQNMLLGIVPLAIGFFVGTKRLAKISIPLYLLTIILLLIVIFAGHSAKGSSRWIPIGPIHFQPSELAKIAGIIFFSWYLSTYKDMTKLASWKDLFLPFIVMIIPLMLILVQPDLGTSLAFLGIVAGMYLVSGVRFKVLAVLALIGIFLAPIAWNFVLKPYQQNRVKTLFNPEADPLGQGYHTIQSKIAIGSGEIFGKGFLKGTQTQLEFLPEHTTDFIFSALSEEWGFFGCSILLTLYLSLILKLMSMATRTKHLFQSYFCIGFAFYLLVHVFVNVGMVIGILPVVGIPLPYISYGGSAMFNVMFLSGIALSISYDTHKL